MAGKKPDIRTDMKIVRKKVQESGPAATFTNKPTRAAGRKAERIAARMQGEQANPKNKETSKTVRYSDQGTHKPIKRKKAA